MINSTKKIIFSTYDDIKNPYYGGGGAIAIHELTKRLSNTFDIEVISWNHSSVKNEVIDGVNYKRIGWSFIGPKLGMFIYQMILPYYASTSSYDIWFESFCPPFTTAFLPLFIKKPVIGVVHMLASEDMERKYKLPFFKIIERIGIKTYKKIITTSEIMKQNLLKINKNLDIEVISNGIPETLRNLHTEKDQILFLGRIEVDQKGIDLLVKAYSQIKQSLRDKYFLNIAGAGMTEEENKMKAIISASGLEKNILTPGRVTGTDKEMVFNHAICAVIPSRFETYSIVALEAMGYGLPVISFGIEGLNWIPSEASIKVPAFSSSELALAISKVLEDEGLRKSMGDFGKKYAKKYTWNAISEQYDSYIRRMTN